MVHTHEMDLIVADHGDMYDEFLDKACTAVEMQEEKEGYHLSLFTSGGAVMVNSDGWTLGESLTMFTMLSAWNNK